MKLMSSIFRFNGRIHGISRLNDPKSHARNKAQIRVDDGNGIRSETIPKT